MSAVFYWVGVVHVAAYALAGGLVAGWAFIEWLIGRLRLKREIVRALTEYYRRKTERNDTGGIRDERG